MSANPSDNPNHSDVPAGGQPASPAEPGAAAGAGPNQTAANPPEPDLALLQGVIEKLNAENNELRDRLLRLAADMENLRKRTEREKQDTARYAISKFAKDVVSIGDNVQRAIKAVPPNAAAQDPALKSFLDGVQMTERELLNVLERNGISREDPNGSPFDPHKHQAMSEIENPAVPHGTVVEVYQHGYLLEDRVLRPALVVVARGGARPAKPPADADEQDARSDGG